jgi:glycerol uptake facilitator-like aquaporin
MKYPRLRILVGIVAVFGGVIGYSVNDARSTGLALADVLCYGFIGALVTAAVLALVDLYRS